MYFSQFPKIYYDFPQDATSTTLQVLTDITLNVRIRKEVLENITIYDEYDIQDGETPEIIAEKVYGNPEYHWVIMLANQRYDYLKDFPMTAAELQEYVTNKYGVDHIDNYHHYEKNGIITEGRATLKVPASVIHEMKINDFIMNEPKAAGRVESINPTTNTINVLMSYGRFDAGDLVSLNGVRSVDVSPTQTINVYTTMVNFNVPVNGFTIAPEYFPITNREFEINENEKKRRIKLISKQLIDQVLREFTTLISPT